MHKKKPQGIRAPWGFQPRRGESADLHHILRLEPFVRLCHRKLNGLPFFKGTKTFSLYGAKMDEDISFSIRPLKKSIPFTCIEPFYFPLHTFRHTQSSRQFDGIHPSGRSRGCSPLILLILSATAEYIFAL